MPASARSTAALAAVCLWSAARFAHATTAVEAADLAPTLALVGGQVIDGYEGPPIRDGVVLIAGVLGGQNYGADPTLGVMLGILTALCYAGYLIIIRQVSRRRIAQPVAVSTATSGAVALAVGLALGSIDLFPGAASMFWLILLGITAQSLGYLFISISLPRLPAVVTSIILLVQPVLAVLFAIVLVGEAPAAGQMLGVAMVIGGIALATVPLGRIRRRSQAAI